MQIYCTKGILSVPDPNYFRGPVKIRPNEDESVWREVPLLYNHTDSPANFRGLGVAEMALAIGRGENPRAAGELAYHVLDVMESIQESYTTGRHVEVRSSCRPPSLLPLDDNLVAAT
jgi:predicted dehydrogenase